MLKFTLDTKPEGGAVTVNTTGVAPLLLDGRDVTDGDAGGCGRGLRVVPVHAKVVGARAGPATTTLPSGWRAAALYRQVVCVPSRRR